CARLLPRRGSLAITFLWYLDLW
nr:immunoglobulin heavy chain junction region [Macaca mulatta]MOV52564.1 immunoglobulin heavy chain junction region [Macaca mulatta]MOV53035.1 immunoglobulin heavy chain junction region [Macaca mulatta]